MVECKEISVGRVKSQAGIAVSGTALCMESAEWREKMSNTQIVLPPPSREEDAVVERFVTASREIVPTVQVSLAKRIIQPGSNRVICLAAQTSVPLNENELASVSDLALRLSDGTNVRLSVSFFNDGDTIGGDFIPFERTIYDPNRYSMKGGGDSKLGLVLCTMAAIAFGSCYAYNNHGFNPLVPTTKTPLQSAISEAKPLAPNSSEKTKPAKSATNIAMHTIKSSPVSAEFAPEPPVRTYARNPRVAPRFRGEESARPRTAKGSSHQPHQSRQPDNMLVPPPPPFALPLGSDAAQFSPSFSMIANPGAALAMPAAKAPNASPHGRSKSPDFSTPVATHTAASPAGFEKADAALSVPAATAYHSPQRIQFDSSVLLPGTASARSSADYAASAVPKFQPFSYGNKSESTPVEVIQPTTEPDRIRSYGTSVTTAPIPGSTLQLERIAAPEQ